MVFEGSTQLPVHDRGSLQAPKRYSHSMSEAAAKYGAVSLWEYLLQDVDPAQSTAPLAAFCFMTGYIDAICFSAIFVWCGFQTGNFVQHALALARLFEGPEANRDLTFHKSDQHALCSLLSFMAGNSLGRIGDRIGAQRRIWLITASLISTIFTAAAAIAFWTSGQPSLASERAEPAWTNAATFVGIGFMSASLGIQAILGHRLKTQFGTTVVITTIWIELLCDPHLFSFTKRVMGRDHRVIAVFSLFLGAFTSRAVLYPLGSAGTLCVGVCLRLLISFGWFFVPSKPSHA